LSQVHRVFMRSDFSSGVENSTKVAKAHGRSGGREHSHGHD